MRFTLSLIAAKTLTHKPPCFCDQFVHLQGFQFLLFALQVFPLHTAAARGHHSHLRNVKRGKQSRGEGDIGRDVTADLRVIFRLIGDESQLRQKLQRPGGTAD